jgi:hypothetical protein
VSFTPDEVIGDHVLSGRKTTGRRRASICRVSWALRRSALSARCSASTARRNNPAFSVAAAGFESAYRQLRHVVRLSSAPCCRDDREPFHAFALDQVRRGCRDGWCKWRCARRRPRGQALRPSIDGLNAERAGARACRRQGDRGPRGASRRLPASGDHGGSAEPAGCWVAWVSRVSASSARMRSHSAMRVRTSARLTESSRCSRSGRDCVCTGLPRRDDAVASQRSWRS